MSLQHTNSPRESRPLPIALLAALVFLLALPPRLVGLGEATTEDEDQWIARAGGFARALEAGDWRATYQIGHPGVTTMWLTTLSLGTERARRFAAPERGGRLVTQLEDFLPALRRARIAFAAANALLVAACALLVARLFGSGPALLAGLLLALDPYWSAMSPIVGMDGLLAGLLACSALSALLAFRTEGGTEGRKDRGTERQRDGETEGGSPSLCLSVLALASGILAGLALLTKAPALLLLPLIPLLVLLELPHDLRDLAGWRPALLKATLWGLGFLAAFALWPAIWADPPGTLRRATEFIRDTGGEAHAPGNFFLGQPVADPGPLFYPVALALRLGPATPIGLALLALLGLPRAWRPAAALLACFALLFLAGLTLSPKKVDRYLLPLVPALGVLAGLGWWRLVASVGAWERGSATESVRAWERGSVGKVRLTLPRSHAPTLPLLVAALVAALQLWPWPATWPHPIAAYSPLFGGQAAAERALPVGWGEGLDAAGDYLRAQPGPEPPTTAIWYPLFVNFQAHAPGPVVNLRFSRPHQVDARDQRLLDQSTFFVDYIHARQRRLTPAFLLDRRPDHVVRIGAIEYARIYRLR